jgi:hypothetical protein
VECPQWKDLYVLKMDLLSSQLSFLSKVEKENIAQLAIFIGVYFARWFLKCALASAAPYTSLVSFGQMIDFSVYGPGLAFTVLDSTNRHTCYLTEQWVVVCLVDDNCPVKERKAVAKILHKTPRADHFEPGKPELPVDFWPENGKLQSLLVLSPGFCLICLVWLLQIWSGCSLMSDSGH